MREDIYATFTDAVDAERAAGALLDNGVRQEDLTIIQPYKEVEESVKTRMESYPEMSPEFAGSTAVPMYSAIVNRAIDESVEEASAEEIAKEGLSTTTLGDAEIGAAKGAGWGFGVGAAAGIASLFIPGFGLVIGGGALALAIGAAVGTTGAGAVVGAVTGFLKDQGFQEPDGKRYEQVVREGGAVLAVSLPSGNVDVAKAWEIVDKYHGMPFSQVASNWRSYLA